MEEPLSPQHIPRPRFRRRAGRIPTVKVRGGSMQQGTAYRLVYRILDQDRTTELQWTGGYGPAGSLALERPERPGRVASYIPPAAIRRIVRADKARRKDMERNGVKGRSKLAAIADQLCDTPRDPISEDQ